MRPINHYVPTHTTNRHTQAILSWRDRLASAAFLAVCCAAMAAIQLLGLSTVTFAGLMWQIRPPRLRDPIPPRPVNYFQRLPCLNDDAF
jgi:hypothetical protein